MQAAILQVSYLTCFGAFALLCGLILVNRKNKTPYTNVLLLGAMSSALWAAGVVGRNTLADFPITFSILELLRTTSWIVFLGTLQGVMKNQGSLMKKSSFILLLGGLAATVIIMQSQIGGALPLSGSTRLLLSGYAFIALSVLGLLILENLYREANSDLRWAVKFLCFGLGAIFAYDFFYYAEIVLFQTTNSALYEARGFVNALAVPLIAIAVTRSNSWSINIHVSRRLAFHSAALIACGLYLIIMAASGYYVREVGGDWGTIFQITFSAGAILLLFILFSSGSLRGYVRQFISRNFYNVKYDYRAEWLRFINTVSSGETGQSLQMRVLQAIAQIIDSRAAVLFSLDEASQRYIPQTSWNFGDNIPSIDQSSLFAEEVLAIEEVELTSTICDRAQETKSEEMTNWLRSKERAWLLLPIKHGDRLIAFMVLGKARAAFEIDDEDKELLKTISVQAASYLSEEQSTYALQEAKEFESFNKRMAFVVHDLKNIVNQLSLMIKNADAHGHKPEFQHDMIATVGSSVTRMTQLLAQLKEKQEPYKKTATPIDIYETLSKIGQEWKSQHSNIVLELDTNSTTIMGDHNRLSAAIGHLLQNALDASEAESPITLKSTLEQSEIRIDIIDCGDGMDERFIREELFKPMSSTKETGFGVGVYQVREYIRDMQGDLKVSSHPGQGTKMSILLPMTSTTVAAE